MTLSNEDAFLTALLIAIVLLAGYLEWSYARGRLMKRRTRKMALELDRDEAFNATVTSMAIVRNMKLQGFDVSAAEQLMRQAEMELDAGKYREAKEHSLETRELLMKIRDGGDGGDMDPKEPREEMNNPQTDEENRPKLPRNYAEASFTIRSLEEDMRHLNGSEQAIEALNAAKKEFENGSYDAALKYAVKARKLMGEEEKGSLQVIPSKEARVNIETVMACPECGAQLREGDRYCRKCGTSIQISCPECGAEVASDDLYCGKCGRSLS